MEGYPWGGSEELWFEMATNALHQKHRVEVSVKYWTGKNSKLETLKTHGAKLHFRKRSFLKSLTNKIRFSMGLHPANSFLGNYDADVLIVNEGSAFEFTKNLYWTRFALNSKVPYSFIIQNVFENEPLNDTRRERALAVYKGAKALYFVSHRNLEVVQRQLAFKLANAAVINNPVAIPVLLPLRSQYSVQDQTINFAVVGRLDCHSKGQDILLEVLSKADWKNRKWHLNLYGVGNDLKHLESLIRYYNLSERVTLNGFTPIEKIWNSNQILIMPSFNEGTSLALLEAMSYGIPSVVTDVGDQAVWVEDGINGFVAAAPTVKLIGQAMERCWQLKSKWLEMGNHARAKIIRCFPQAAGTDLLERVKQLVP